MARAIKNRGVLALVGAVMFLTSRGALAQPSITLLNPPAVAAGSPGFNLTIIGSGFVPGDVTRINGSARATIFITSQQLMATILASDVAAPAALQITVTDPNGASSKPAILTVTGGSTPPSLRRVSPGFAAQGADRIEMTLLGTNFRPGATVVISPPLPDVTSSTGVNQANDIAVLSTTFISSTLMTAVVSLSPAATVSLRAVDVLNSDGTSTATIRGNGSGTSQPLRVQSSHSLGVPLSILNLALTHPRDGTVVTQGKELNAEAILGGTGTGTVIGEWVWDGNVVEQFSASVVGGQSAAIQTRQSLPTWLLGVHTLQLRMLQPNQVATRTVAVVVNPGDWRLEELLLPRYGAMFPATNPPVLVWAAVPGAAKYQVGFSAQPYFSTVDQWYDVTDNHWKVSPDIWHSLPEGELFWTVRTVESSGVTRKPPPMRSILRAPEQSLSAARPEPGKTPAGNTLLEWIPVAKGALYLVTVSSDREGAQIIRKYLTHDSKVDLRAIDRRLEPGKTYFWRVDAISSSGRLLLAGPPQSFVAGVSRTTRRYPRGGELLQLASFTLPGNLPREPADILSQIAKRTPEPNSTVADLQPNITVEFRSNITPTDISLTLDDLDVTSMAQINDAKLSYMPALQMADGEHAVNLVVGTEVTSWKFSVSEPAGTKTAAAQPATSSPGAVQSNNDAEIPPPPPITASLAIPAGQPQTTKFSSNGQIGMNTQWASGSNPPDYNAISAAQHMLYQDGPWRAEVNGSGLFNSILNPESLRTAQGRTNDYVAQLAYQSKNWRANLRFGIVVPVLFTDAQFVTSATPRQGVEATVTNRSGTLGFFTNTNDLALGGGAGITFHQGLMGASWTLPWPKEWVEFRLMWLSAQDVGSPTTVTFDAHGIPIITPSLVAAASNGDVYGALLKVHITPKWLWTSEYAWSYDNPNASDPTSTRLFGRAWRTSVAGQAGKTLVSVAYRDVGPNFGNPANPSLTPASQPDLRGVDATATQTTRAGTFGLGYSFLQNNVRPVSSPELVLHSFNESWTKSFGVKTTLVAAARESLTQTGTIPAALAGLPPDQQGAQDIRDISGNVTLSRQVGTVTMSLGGVRDWNRNNIFTTADTITSALTLGANWISKGFFQLNSQVNFNWVAAEKFTIGATRNISAYIQPSIFWRKYGLQISPIISLSQGRTLLATDTLTSDNLTGQYGGRLSWTLPGALKFNTLSVQGSYNQNRDRIIAFDQRSTQLFVLWTMVWGQKTQPVHPVASTPITPVPIPKR